MISAWWLVLVPVVSFMVGKFSYWTGRVVEQQIHLAYLKEQVKERTCKPSN